MKKKTIAIPGVDSEEVVKEVSRILSKGLDSASRRRFLRQGLTLGGAMLLTGCDFNSDAVIDNQLMRISRFNDRAQGWLFNPKLLAPEYPESMITQPFPFNAYYSQDEIRQVNGDSFRLEISGLVDNKYAWSLPELYAMAQVTQVTRHICVEGWSAIGKWGGIPFARFLHVIGADLNAKYVGFKCADDYYTSIDMPTALHPQTQLTLTYDGKILPAKYGFPMKLRMPTKLGYKNPKYIQSIFVTNTYPGGFWEDQGYNWFGGS